MEAAKLWNDLNKAEMKYHNLGDIKCTSNGDAILVTN